jgi:hypothetical protein
MMNHLNCDYCFASIDPEADPGCIIPAPPRPCYPVFELILCPPCRAAQGDAAERQKLHVNERGYPQELHSCGPVSHVRTDRD